MTAMAPHPAEHTSGSNPGSRPVPLDGRVFKPGELNELVRDAAPSTPDDQSRTFDGRVLDTKAKMLEFLAEIEVARAEGREFDHE
jgi:hypothetical protein